MALQSKRTARPKVLRRWAANLPAIGMFVLFLVFWEAYCRLKGIPRGILPAPTMVLKGMWAARVVLWGHLEVTLLEILLGFLFGFGAGAISGILIVYSRTMERLLFPIIIASQVIPIFAIAPLLIIWFGFGIAPKVLIAALIVFFPICVNQVEGLRSVDAGMINLMRSYKATEWQVFRYVRMPASVPFLIAGTQVGITFSVIGAVIGEWVGSEKGLGAYMLTSNSMMRTDLVFAAIVLLAVVGVGLFVSVRLLGNWLVPWQKQMRN